jgi:Hemerythrin HHE cation binding domain
VIDATKTPPTTQPAVTVFLLAQLRALRDEACRVERIASGSAGASAMAVAMDRLRRRLTAHVVVEERLLVSFLHGSHAYRDLLTLEDEHEALEHRVAEVQAGGCPAPEVAALGRALRAHIEEESRIVRLASGAAEHRLSEIPPWRAEELFECAGGPTQTWPGEWLG